MTIAGNLGTVGSFIASITHTPECIDPIFTSAVLRTRGFHALINVGATARSSVARETVTGVAS